MENVSLEQRILFYYDDEYDYNYTEVFNCVSYEIYSSCNQRNFVKEVVEINVKLYTTCSYNKLTKFKKGNIFINNIEFEILDFNLYYHFFVNHKLFHRIGICRINKEAFYQIKNMENKYLKQKRLLFNLQTNNNNNNKNKDDK